MSLISIELNWKWPLFTVWWVFLMNDCWILLNDFLIIEMIIGFSSFFKYLMLHVTYTMIYFWMLNYSYIPEYILWCCIIQFMHYRILFAYILWKDFCVHVPEEYWHTLSLFASLSTPCFFICLFWNDFVSFFIFRECGPHKTNWDTFFFCYILIGLCKILFFF